MIEEINEDNPLGGTIERYDIEMEKELINREEMAEKEMLEKERDNL